MPPEDEPPVPEGDCQRRLVIPAELHSFTERGPFTRCSSCSTPLAETGYYEVQKVYRQKEVVFEMAICKGCAATLCQEMSEESLQAIKGFLVSQYRPSPEIFHCHFCGFPRPLIAGYTLCGVCSGAHLVCPAILMCEGCAGKLQARLSRQTRGAQDDFVRNTFPGVGADFDLSPTLGTI